MMTVDPRRLSEADVVISDTATRRALAARRERRLEAAGLALAAGSGGAERHWIVLAVRRHAEGTVDKLLGDAGIETWLPVRKMPVTRRGTKPAGRAMVTETPAFPGYLFVRIAVSAEALHALLAQDDVAGMIHVEGRPKAIGDKEINLLRRMIDDGWLDRTVQAKRLRGGQAVMIRDGAFAWMQAAFEGYVGTTHVRVLTALMGRAVPLTLELAQIVESD